LTVMFDNKLYRILTKIAYTVKNNNWLICLLHLYYAIAYIFLSD